jgi:hypothetical protein
MLRTNLATRPFYNERAIHLLLALAAMIVLAITVLNVSRIITLSRHSTELSARTNADRAEASRLSTEATRIRRTINKDELTLVVNAAQEANALIDQRTFSWTEFFNRIEATIPPDVMLTSVRPSFKDGVTRVTMIVVGRQVADIDEFMEKLEATGFFEEIVPPPPRSPTTACGGPRLKASTWETWRRLKASRRKRRPLLRPTRRPPPRHALGGGNDRCPPCAYREAQIDSSDCDCARREHRAVRDRGVSTVEESGGRGAAVTGSEHGARGRQAR